MASNSKIRWKRTDYLTLGRAVSNFNKKIRELQTEENKLYLPDTIEYGQIKKEILTRGKLNDVLRSLRRFNQESAQPVYSEQAKQYISKWESRENIIKSQRAKRILIREAKQIGETLKLAKEGKKNVPYKERQKLKMQYLEALENLRDIKAYREKSELPYMSYKDMVSRIGNIDYEMIKSTIFRQNFENIINNYYKNFRGYELLANKLNRLNNPMYFYKYVTRSEFFKDIFLKYRKGAGVELVSASDQDEFNEALEQTGLVKEEKNKLIRKYEKEENEEMLKKAQSIETAEDLFEILGI